MDILTVIKEALTPEAVRKMSGELGEFPQNTQAAFAVAVPAILAGIWNQSIGEKSAMSPLTDLFSSGSIDGSLLWNLESLLDGPHAEGLLEMGRSILKSVFGDKLPAVQDAIAQQSGVQATSVSRIMAVAGPMAMAAISRVAGQPTTQAAITSLLRSERSAILAALPPGLAGMMTTARTPMAQPKAGGVSFLTWALPALLIFGGLLWYLLSNAPQSPSETAVGKFAAAAESVQDAAKSGWSALGEFFKRRLPSGLELNIPRLGIENRLIDFIEDTARPVDKTTWFDFDRLLFDTGQATLQPSSQEQLANVKAILDAYPKVHLKIGGYTDNTGDKTRNLQLSADRANSVMKALVDLGVAPTRLTAEGYGQEHPVADNATEEGRAKNRRISLRVTQK